MRTSPLRFAVLALVALLAGCGSSSPPTATRPPDAAGAVVFTAAGDFGMRADAAATLDRMAATRGALDLALGDLSYSSPGSESAWCDFVKAKFGPTFPVQIVAGNHEEDTGEYGRIDDFAACLPDRLGVTGDYAKQYYFDYQGLARVIMISPDLTIRDQHYYYGDGNENYRWLAGAIDGARAAGIPWVVVGMHKTCVSIGAYYCAIYEDLFDLLIEKRVDLVLHAHDHTYQRSKQLATGPACPDASIEGYNAGCVADGGADNLYAKGVGPVFVVIGTGGGDLYDIDTNDPEAGNFARWMGKNSNPRKGFLKVAVSRTELVATFVGSTATSDFADGFTIRPAAR